MNNLMKATDSIMESVIVKGDIAKLTPDERVRYYGEVCRSMGLNPLTKPFEFITLNGKLTLYALRACTDQLRQLKGISLEIVSKEVVDEILTVHVRARDNNGRTDEDLGAVSFPATLRGEARANAELKAVTKAKRRATLSICGLGWLDETEVEDIPAAAKRPAPPAANVMLPLNNHDQETGELHGELDRPAVGEPAASILPSHPEGAAGISDEDPDSEEVMRWDTKLAAANNTEDLQRTWKAVPASIKPVLKPALDRRHKPRVEQSP